MRKLLLCTYLIVLAAVSVGCTSERSFVIRNASDARIAVDYQFAPLPARDGAAPPVFAMHPPETEVNDGPLAWETRWQAFPEGYATVDRANGAVHVVLDPQQALRIAHAFDYKGSESWDFQVRIVKLTITGAAGRIDLEGDAVRRHFIESDGVFLLVYK